MLQDGSVKLSAQQHLFTSNHNTSVYKWIQIQDLAYFNKSKDKAQRLLYIHLYSYPLVVFLPSSGPPRGVCSFVQPVIKVTNSS